MPLMHADFRGTGSFGQEGAPPDGREDVHGLSGTDSDLDSILNKPLGGAQGDGDDVEFLGSKPAPDQPAADMDEDGEGFPDPGLANGRTASDADLDQEQKSDEGTLPPNKKANTGTGPPDPPQGKSSKKVKKFVGEGISGPWLQQFLLSLGFVFDCIIGPISGEFVLPEGTIHVNNDMSTRVAAGKKNLAAALDMKRCKTFLFVLAKPALVFKLALELRIAWEDGHTPLIAFFWGLPFMPLPPQQVLNMASTPFTYGNTLKPEGRGIFVGRCACTTGLHSVISIRGELQHLLKMTQMLVVHKSDEHPSDLTDVLGSNLRNGPRYQLNSTADGAEVIWVETDESGWTFVSNLIQALQVARILIRSGYGRSIYNTPDIPRRAYTIVVSDLLKGTEILHLEIHKVNPAIRTSAINIACREAISDPSAILIEAGINAVSILQQQLSASEVVHMMPVAKNQWLAKGPPRKIFQAFMALTNALAGDARENKIWGYTDKDGVHVSHKQMTLTTTSQTLIVPGATSDLVPIGFTGDFRTWKPDTITKSLNELLALTNITDVGEFRANLDPDRNSIQLLGPATLRQAVQARLLGSLILADHAGRETPITFDPPPEEEDPMKITPDLVEEMCKHSEPLRERIEAQAKAKAPPPSGPDAAKPSTAD